MNLPNMPFVRILIHAVWATKDCKSLMSLQNKHLLCQHIKEYAVSKNIHLLNTDGWHDHIQLSYFNVVRSECRNNQEFVERKVIFLGK